MGAIRRFSCRVQSRAMNALFYNSDSLSGLLSLICIIDTGSTPARVVSGLSQNIDPCRSYPYCSLFHRKRGVCVWSWGGCLVVRWASSSLFGGSTSCAASRLSHVSDSTSLSTASQLYFPPACTDGLQTPFHRKRGVCARIPARLAHPFHRKLGVRVSPRFDHPFTGNLVCLATIGLQVYICNQLIPPAGRNSVSKVLLI